MGTKEYAGSTTISRIVEKIKELFCRKSDIVDNCESEDANSPLSAKQGCVLQGQIDKIEETMVTATVEEVKDYLSI